MKKVLLILLGLVGGILILSFFYAYSQLYDRHPNYAVDLSVFGGKDSPLQVGAGAVSITPEIVDTWNDANGDSRYFEEDGDTYNDNNNNGVFDAYWIAGFSNRRPANGVHDQLWARAMVFDDGNLRVAIVALDAIGFGSDDVIDLRNYISEEAHVDYVIVTSSHTHEAPDLIGIWGESEFRSGVNPAYMEMVQKGGAKAVEMAVKNLQPASLQLVQDLEGASDLVEDTRPPFVMDPGVRLMHARNLETKVSIGTLYAWANHPETLWDDNLLLTSDFPHFVRSYMENGVYDGDSLIASGLGGMTMYVNGAIGGLMTSTPSMAIQDPISGKKYTDPSFEKADAQGKALALLGLNALKDSTGVIATGGISVVAKTIELPLDNSLFRLAASLGVLDRGLLGWWKMRSEVSALSIGPATFLMVPGEIYPEIINGGVELPEGADFSGVSLESPGLRSLMPGEYKFVIGLANDMVGYIIPKSQWDAQSPYTFGSADGHYGEINSVSPEAAQIVYREAEEVLEKLKNEID